MADDTAGMFGLTLAPITDGTARLFDRPRRGSVLVAAVAAGSEAEEKSVKPGDVIVR